MQDALKVFDESSELSAVIERIPIQAPTDPHPSHAASRQNLAGTAWIPKGTLSVVLGACRLLL